MSSPVTTDSADGVTVITMDDGKANALSFEKLRSRERILERLAAAIERDDAEFRASIAAQGDT